LIGAIFVHFSNSYARRVWKKPEAIMGRAKGHKVPKVGAKFQKTFKERKYRLTVVTIPNGIGYEVGGKVFKSPSAAARSIARTAVNGWKFWHLDKG
jgi:hypothetical protein